MALMGHRNCRNHFAVFSATSVNVIEGVDSYSTEFFFFFFFFFYIEGLLYQC